MTKRKIVLFFTDRIFWPANDGHKVVLTNYCKGLVSEYDCDVHVLSFLEAGQDEQSVLSCPDFISSVALANKPDKKTIVKNLATALAMGVCGGPVQCALFKSKAVAKQLRDLTVKLKPSHVFIDLPRLSPYIDAISDLPCKKVLYMEDSFSVRYQRQLNSLNTLNKTGGVAGKYSANFKGGVAKLASNSTLQKFVLGTESARMRRLELDAPKKYDFVVLVSPVEAERLTVETGNNNVIAVPLGVDCPFYTSGPEPSPRPGVISFLGDMRAAANADSLRYIADEVLPLIGPDVMLEVVGTASEDLIDEFKNNNQIKFLGRVEDTRAALRSTSVFLAPIAYGTGIKTKILEAMAIGVPIVTNAIGNEGIGLIDCVDAFVADGATGQAAAVRRLLDDKDLAIRLVSSARRKAIEIFDWQKSLANFSYLGFESSEDAKGDVNVA